MQRLAADGSDSSGRQPAESADRASRRDGQTDTHGEGPRDKAEGRGTNNSNKDKSKNR